MTNPPQESLENYLERTRKKPNEPEHCPHLMGYEGCLILKLGESITDRKIVTVCQRDYTSCKRYQEHAQTRAKCTRPEDVDSDGQNSPGMGGCRMPDASEPFPYAFDGQN